MFDRNKSVKLFFDVLQVLVFSFVFNWGLRATVADARVVPTPSMLPQRVIGLPGEEVEYSRNNLGLVLGVDFGNTRAVI